MKNGVYLEVLNDLVMNNDTVLKYEQYFDDPLFCSFTEILDRYELTTTGLRSVDIWSRALEIYSQLSRSRRPELLVRGLFPELIKENNTETAGIILICVMYIILSRDVKGDKLYLAAKKIAGIVADHPLFIDIFASQRDAELREEESGNPVPSDYYQSKGTKMFEDPVAPFGNSYSKLDDDLKTCVADKNRFEEFVKIINSEIITFILSTEGAKQLWEAVRDISVQNGYIAKRCSRSKFARIIEIVCPMAGDATRINHSMEQFDLNNPKNANDITSIKTRFKLPAKSQ